MVDSQWRLDRIRAIENNLFSLGFEEKSSQISTWDVITSAPEPPT
jgi:hypothetical protein